MEVLLILGAIVAPFLYAVTNHVDNILLKDYKDSTLTLWVISLLVSGLPAFVIFGFYPEVMDMGMFHIGIMFVNGLLNTTLLWLYLQAMDEDEPTATITFYQLVPIFGLVLGYLVLGETFGLREFAGMGFIMVGTAGMVLSADSIALRFRTVLLMAGASLCWAGESTLFKVVALEEDVWQALFWENFAMFVYGLLVLLVPAVRTSIKAVVKRPGKMLTLSTANELLYIAGNVAASVMLTMVPVAMNLLFNTFQTFFVLGIGLVINYFRPGYEKGLTKDTVWKYIICIVVTAIGVYLIGEWE
jgi:drug/metabolite transporter (DMT)-like permease